MAIHINCSTCPWACTCPVETMKEQLKGRSRQDIKRYGENFTEEEEENGYDSIRSEKKR